MSRPIYFFSDAHLGAADPRTEALKIRRIKKLLGLVKQEQGRLYILGDLFDFWFEYRTVVQADHLGMIRELAELRKSGVETTMLVGNHDFWMGRFMEQELGIKVVKSDLDLELDGSRVLLSHGDGLDKSDYGYRLMKVLLRSPVTIWLFGLIHPDLAIGFARWFSRVSRNHLTKNKYLKDHPLLDRVREFWGQGYQAVVFGHVHQPALLEEKGRLYLNIGDFIRNFSYAVYRDGRFSIEKITD
jgi:UDP-2,3-diacylglucosamine hydrolase